MRPHGSKMRVIVAGMIAADPHHGGATWAVLQYVLGLRELGHEVLFIEPLRAASLRPEGTALQDSENARYFTQVTRKFALETNAALLLEGTTNTVGVGYADLRQFARSADLLLNISGMLTEPELLEPIPRRAYLDLDPAFIQLWQAVCNVDMRFSAHNSFITVGLGLGTSGCPVPICGIDWQKTFQPVVLAEWPVAEEIRHDALTTIANWRGYGSIEHEGRHYGQKAHSFRRFMSLPTRTNERFALALAIDPGEKNDLAALSEHGWTLLDPRQVAGTTDDYRRFVQGSLAEFGVAKTGYADSRCGWFSDRSACYLASGRPVIAQETGWSRYLPAGEGALAFETAEDALVAIEALRRDYPRQARAARALAERHFDSRQVLPRLLELADAAR
jgi:hypothetical protein